MKKIVASIILFVFVAGFYYMYNTRFNSSKKERPSIINIGCRKRAWIRIWFTTIKGDESFQPLIMSVVIIIIIAATKTSLHLDLTSALYSDSLWAFPRVTAIIAIE